MYKTRFCFVFIALHLGVGVLVSAHADVKRLDHGIELYYNALPSVDISPSTMKRYGLQRSKNLGLANLSVLHTKPDPMGGPNIRTGINADIQCYTVNLNNQKRDLEIQAVKSGEALYYLSLFPITNQDEIRFNCAIVLPQSIDGNELSDEERNISLKFSKKFHVPLD